MYSTGWADLEDKRLSEEQNSNNPPAGLGRRQFIGALGASATSAIFLQHFARAQDGIVYYQDSLGEIVPASPYATELGIAPLPAPAPSPASAVSPRASSDAAADPCGSTSIQPGYTSPNFLMIMVDQLRSPRWLPPGGLPGNLLPNIDWLLNHSVSFSNYFVAAAACTPSRSTLLTGLYAQQTCLFQTQAPLGCQPPLRTGFPNIATVPGQSSQQIGGGWVPYTSYWIGKWHLSDAAQNGAGMGANGPTDYGFTLPQGGGLNLNLPPDKSIPSPNGVGNLATEGYNPSGLHPTRDAQPPGTQPPDDITSPLYCDAAIVDFFLTQWLPNAPPSPWFTAVSLVNPHDISAFPFSYNLNGTPGFGGTPPNHPASSYQAPPPVARQDRELPEVRSTMTLTCQPFRRSTPSCRPTGTTRTPQTGSATPRVRRSPG